MLKRRARPSAAGLTLAVLLLCGLGVRLWGVKNGLPFVYNLDEGSHFVKLAVRYFGEGYNPDYFQNPPGFSYILNVIYAFGYGGIWPKGAGVDVKRIFSEDPTQLYVIARVTAGVFGLAAAGVLYFVGKRLYGAGAGLVAAALLLFTFLPVHYGHLALNDIPTLLPLVIGLLGTVIIYQRGSWVGYLVAGAGLGVAIAFKYTAAALVIPIVVAYGLRILEDRSRWRTEGLRLVAAGALSVVGFLIFNPYALLDHSTFLYYVHRQQRYSSGVPKVGLDDETGWQYYLWTLKWGFGWIPTGLAVVGAVLALRKDWRKATLLLSFVFPYWLYMGSQERFYARWFLPEYPFLALFAGYAVVRIAQLAPTRWRIPAGVAVAAAALALPFIHVIHNDRVLSRDDTRELARTWLLENLPKGDRMVLEQIASPGFARVREDRSAEHIWRTYVPKNPRVEDYIAGLKPSLLKDYARQGFCVVVVGSNMRDRAFKNPNAKGVKSAIAYYNKLDRDAETVATFSPMKPGHKLPEFNYDISYDFYPLGYERPGPEVKIYRLRNGWCANQAILRGETGLHKPMPKVDPPQDEHTGP